MLRRLAAPLLLATLACGGPPPARPTPTPAKTQPAKPAPVQAEPARTEPARPEGDPQCEAAAGQLAALEAPADVAEVRALYENTPLQALIKTSDAATGRKDDAAVLAALAEAGPPALPAAVTAIQGALSQWMRHNLKVAGEGDDASKRPTAWRAARCAWERAVRPIARDLAGRMKELSSESARDDASIPEDIDAQFAIDPTDERKVRPAHQAIEKTWYRVLHRRIEEEAARARDGKDPVAARRTLGLFAMLRDRLQDRNTPGIALVEAMLSGDPAKIDPAVILKQIDIALIKRARKYCSEAVDPKYHGTAAGAATVQEGATYTRVFLPRMRAALGGKFDPAAHMTTWQQFAEAVDSGDDKDEIKKLSEELVLWNCAYQQSLGIRECTATADEVPAK